MNFYVGVAYCKGLSSIDLGTLGKVKETVDAMPTPNEAPLIPSRS
jgi:hypothetical protein